MDDFINTPLYRGCKGMYGKRKDWEEILENLCQVFQDDHVRVNVLHTDINLAFTWESTEQGHAYWFNVWIGDD